MGKDILAYLIVALILIYPADGANILFFFLGGTYSHKLSAWPLVCSLADRGHNVTVFSTYYVQPRPHPGVTDLTSGAIAAYLEGTPAFNPLRSRRRKETLELWRSGFQLTLDLCQTFMSKTDDPTLRYLVHDAKFDLVINNAVISDCGYILTHHYGAKLIISSSTVVLPWYLELFGVPSEASWVPDWSEESKFPMSILDRWKSLYMPSYYHLYRQLYIYPELERIAKETYLLRPEVVPSMMEVEKNASLVLVHTHFSTGFARSYPPMFIDVGGMQCWEPGKKVSTAIQRLLDDVRKKVILVSFGSSIDTSAVNDPLKSILLQAMELLPHYQFLWRGKVDGNYPSNVFISEWLPQAEILQHPNVAAFITHGGLNGVAEATYGAVPLIVIPLFADQDYNAYRIEAQNLGVRLELRELNPGELVKAVKTVTGNPLYRNRMGKLSRVFKDRPMNPTDTATFWTEFVLRNDDLGFMKPGSTELSWFRRHVLDVLVPLFLTLFALLFIAVLFTIRTVMAAWFALQNIRTYTVRLQVLAFFAKLKEL